METGDQTAAGEFEARAEAASLHTFAFACLIGGLITLGQLRPQSDPKKAEASPACPFSIIGMWKPASLPDADPFLLNFSADGSAAIFTPSEGISPDEFEMVDAVKYRVESGSRPKRIEFTARRGNDVFPPGTTSSLLTEYDEESFITKDPQSGLSRKWTRVQTHRYFLTFAGRRPDSEQEGSAFAMWTSTDGRKPERESFGLFQTKDDAGKVVPGFGAVPAEVSGDFESESRKDSEPMLRIELAEAEFERSHKVLEVWRERVEKHRLPSDDPYLNAMELFKSAAENINTCRKEAKLRTLDRPALDDLASRNQPLQRPIEYIRALRKKNNELHIPDSAFPWSWRPMLSSPH